MVGKMGREGITQAARPQDGKEKAVGFTLDERFEVEIGKRRDNASCKSPGW